MAEIMDPATNSNNNNNQIQVQKPLAIPISEKLSSDNFLTWIYQVTQTISGQKLQHHLDKNKIPTQIATEEDRAAGKETKEYQEWRIEDYNVNSWLFAFLDASFKYRILGCNFAQKLGADCTLFSPHKQDLGDPPLSIPDLEALLMAEEELIERLKKPDTNMEEEADQAMVAEEAETGIATTTVHNVKFVANWATLLCIATSDSTLRHRINNRIQGILPSHKPCYHPLISTTLKP
ncbi:hypothetical protein PIB30_031073 [Stylosanthes scabra]|uniref:Uncharacterized protein n=1 Tax=Stylosanthes scabra TaxID=79078 RepID=A0ABU6SBP2_9FABA|nr:hypothetical protein [Stylosanthes scabra]